MPELLLYLLKVNVALVLFYLAYHVALRRLTFYHLNRLFLVFGIVFSTVYPFIDLAELFAQHQPIANAYIVTIPAWELTGQTIAQTPTFDYWQLPVYLFWAGVMVMLVRFIVQLVSLYKIHAASEPANYKSIGFRKSNTINHAFSFWQTIYLNPEQHKRDELEQILHHELIHITGWHTIDVLLAELSTVFYWFNPGAWLMKKAVKENLEFIADQNVVNTGVDKKEYQYLLLKVVGATQPQIANQFNFPSLKRRIAMMNKMPTSRAGKLRLLIALPLVAVLLVAFRSAASEMETIVSPTETEIQQQNNDKTLPKELVEHLKKNPAIKSVRGRVIDNKSAVVISLKGGGTEVYYLSDEASITELERKYGLPELPAPPPPVRANEELPPPPPPAPETPELPPPPPPVREESKLAMNLPDGVVYYIDGKEDKSEAYKKLDPKQVYSINVYKGENAEEVFGKNAAKGVVSIITQKNKNAKQVQEFQRKFSELPAPPPPVKDINSSLNKAFFEQNPNVARMFWVTSGETGKEQKVTGFVLKLKNGETEHYEYSDRNSINAYRDKYGDLPKVPESLELPAPPPPTAQNGSVMFSPAGNEYYKNNLPEDYKAFLKRNPQVNQIAWKFTDMKDFNLESVVIFLKTGKTEEYQFNQSYKIPALEEKYGELPALPAPPPPVKIKSIDKRESSVIKPATRNTYAQIDTLSGTAAQIKKLLYARQKTGEPAVDNLILFTKNSKGQGIDVYAKLDGTTIESVKVLATAN